MTTRPKRNVFLKNRSRRRSRVVWLAFFFLIRYVRAFNIQLIYISHATKCDLSPQITRRLLYFYYCYYFCCCVSALVLVGTYVVSVTAQTVSSDRPDANCVFSKDGKGYMVADCTHNSLLSVPGNVIPDVQVCFAQ